MKKILIFGVSGSGKTTFSKKLSKKLKIKEYDLDEIYYIKDEYIQRKTKERDEILNKIVSKKTWIIEGSHTERWISPIFKKVDLIIILRPNLNLCKRRVLIRFFKRKFKKNNKKEKFAQVKKIIKKFINKERLDKKLNQLKRLNKMNAKTIILTNKKEINTFLARSKA